jgi:glycosyltransferase involved in cell wall biosynthesis
VNRPGPLATIVIPTHDRPRLLERAVASALAQTVEDIQVVVVDDGSAEPVRLGLEDPRLLVVRNPRALGASAARNAGLRMAEGHWVTFTDDDDELLPDMVQVGLEAGEGSVRFSVVDEGMGIPSHEQARIFEKFYRLDPNMTRGIGGTGLGLYISSELVRRFDGPIVDVGSGNEAVALVRCRIGDVDAHAAVQVVAGPEGVRRHAAHPVAGMSGDLPGDIGPALPGVGRRSSLRP